jgi:D-arabinose 1-dehydrogenase-like Zn-dependent alcohol dehydrogenase
MASSTIERRASTASSHRTMRAAQLTALRELLQVTEVPVAAPRADGAVLRVEASGVCRSDWHFWNGDLQWIGFNLPLPAVGFTGHEVGGVVEEIGPDVETIKVGDRVTIPFHESDGTCPECRAGFQNLCDHVIVPGVGRTGGWAQHVTVTAADLNCIRLPDGVDSLSAAALGCRYMTAYRAVMDRGRVQPGQWLAVQGCGGVGLSAVQIGAAADALVVAVDIDDRKLTKAREEGATATVNARGLSPEQVGRLSRMRPAAALTCRSTPWAAPSRSSSRYNPSVSGGATCRWESALRRSAVRSRSRWTFSHSWSGRSWVRSVTRIRSTPSCSHSSPTRSSVPPGWLPARLRSMR